MSDYEHMVPQAGATAVVPETLEPSLQLASAVLAQLNMPADEVSQAIQDFRKSHVAELQVRNRNSGLHAPSQWSFSRLYIRPHHILILKSSYKQDSGL